MRSKRIVWWSAGLLILALFVAWLVIVLSEAHDGPEIFAKADLMGIADQLNVYRERNGSYPTTQQGLHALVAQPESSPVPHNWA